MNKSRNLSPIEFLDILQKEYFLALLRSKIYPTRKKKEYFTKVYKGKEKKILSLSKKYTLDCVFYNEKLYNNYKELIWGDNFESRPDFFYRDQIEKEELEVSDYMNYYNIDSAILFLFNYEQKAGKIIKILTDFSRVKALSKGIKYTIKIENLKRII